MAFQLQKPKIEIWLGKEKGRVTGACSAGINTFAFPRGRAQQAFHNNFPRGVIGVAGIDFGKSSGRFISQPWGKYHWGNGTDARPDCADG